MANHAMLAQSRERTDFDYMHQYDGPLTKDSPQHMHPQAPHDMPPEPPAGLAPSRVQELLGDCRGPRRVVVSHPGELLPPSRGTLLQAYDACHEREGWRQVADRRQANGRWSEDGGQCALQIVWPDEVLTKAVRLAATVDIYRGLTGDMTTPDQALADHALLVGKKRNFAHNTPSASFRRWLNEPPFPGGYRRTAGSIGYEYAITPDDAVSFMGSLRKYGAAPRSASPPPRSPPSRMTYADHHHQVSPSRRSPPRSHTPPAQRSQLSPARQIPPASHISVHDAFGQISARSATPPGPADYDQSRGTLADGVFDKSVSHLPGGFGKNMRRSASFASSRPRSSGVVDGFHTTGPRKGPHKGVLKHNYFYDQPPPTRPVRPTTVAADPAYATAHGESYGYYPGVDLQRVASVFAKFGDGRFIQCKDLWGALHHYGVETTSRYAHRVVHAYDKHPEGQLEMQDLAVIVRQIEAPHEERERREAEAETARTAAMERSNARMEAEERARREAAAEWARTAALDSARIKSEEARMRRQRYEAKAAEERVWAEAKAAEEAALRQAEQYEYEWRKKAQEEAAVAEAWRQEQREADARSAWGEAWADADMRRTYRDMHGHGPSPSYDTYSIAPAPSYVDTYDRFQVDSDRIHHQAKQKVAFERSLPPPGPYGGTPPAGYMPGAIPAVPGAHGGMMPQPGVGYYPPTPMVGQSPDNHARLLAAETAAAEAMAALERVQRETHGAAVVTPQQQQSGR